MFLIKFTENRIACIIKGPPFSILMEENWRKRQISQIMVTNKVDETEKELKKKKQLSTHRLTEHDRRLSKEFGPTALNVVKKLHRQLGHPGNDRLVRALRDAKFDDSVVQCGRQVRCDVCESFAPRKLDRQLLCHKQPISMTFWRWTLFT